MSVKSLLQLILLLLIIIIIGGLYYVYFYSGPVNVQRNDETLLKINESSSLSDISVDQEILEGLVTDNQDKINNTKNVTSRERIADKKKNFNKKDFEKSKKNETLNTVGNLTKDIEYITSNSDGDIFKILAKSGRSNKKNPDILNLETVKGVVSSKKRSKIYISSNYAEYNYSNQNSKFYQNVVIKYEDKIITCDNFDLNISENIAVGYNNVIINDNLSSMKAQKITMNMITKDIKINSNDKIEIKTN